MANRYHLHAPAQRPNQSFPHTWSQPTTPIKDSSSLLRPLSDIREITEPSIAEPGPTRTSTDRGLSTTGARQTALRQGGTVRRGNSVRIVDPRLSEKAKGKQRLGPQFSPSTESEEGQLDRSSTFTIPPTSIPPRASSQNLQRAPVDARLTVDGHSFPIVPKRVTNRGGSNSPVREARDKYDPVESDTPRRIPSKTFVRDPCPFDIIDQPTSRHCRLSAQLQVVAPLFVGGGSVEGFARLAFDSADSSRQKHSFLISGVSIDLLGIEELVGQHRRSVFLSLATELLSADSPPPPDMVESTTPLSFRDCLWVLRPSVSHLPFRISLPLDVGPAPFHTKTARIRYLLALSVHFNDNGRQLLLRQSQEITVLSTYDPERALRSLPSPLTAFDEIHMTRHKQVETIRLTAGLHRQVWVSGSSIFVDIHVANNSHKNLKRLELSVERDILYYRHAAASTLEKSASQARIFQDKEQTILKRSTMKVGKHGWNGISPYSSIVRTCDIEIPRGHTTVRCGKFFEVRYFLNVTIGSTHMRFLSVQLPIILIHMNSLDVVPNAVGQVAAAIEEKRAARQEATGRKTSHSSAMGRHGQHSRDHSSASSAQSRARNDPARIQGKAFAAPRHQSLEQHRAAASELQQIGKAVDRSPRRYERQSKPTSNSPRKTGQKMRSTQHQAKTKTEHDRGVHHHKFALHNAPSNQSLGGLSVGSYTVLNGSNMSINMDGNGPAQSSYVHNLSGSVRQRLRGMRSLDSFRRTKTDVYHTSPYDDPNPQTLKDGDRNAVTPGPGSGHPLGLQMQPSALGMDQQQPIRKRRNYDTIRGRRSDNPHDQTGSRHPSLARRASLKLRDSLDGARFEFAAVKQKSTGGTMDWWKRSKSKSRAEGKVQKEMSMDWWNQRSGMAGNEGRSKGKEREGWI
ncbi:hypothetical protein CAC42_5532 [Sphaceloma murrayae]|uniref:Arrestin C-terminal-like domain-containing protein n=1 Tax=Sphaceloma murrayae TaxID=2082308 RepID=A0A2K1QYF9_9PEZI|nr:hypothetical protein CAC42_5532 [Sphaceloma murrayae]